MAYFLTSTNPNKPARKLTRNQTKIIYNYINQYIPTN